MLIQVWDKDGVMFEVTPANAHDLVTHAGWSRTPPSAPAPAPEPEPTAPEPEVVRRRGRPKAQEE